MSGFLSPEELRALVPAETLSFASPIPTQIVSSDEFLPPRQNKAQREVEARLKEMGTRLAVKQGMSGRSFFCYGSRYGRCISRHEPDLRRALRCDARRGFH